MFFYLKINKLFSSALVHANNFYIVIRSFNQYIDTAIELQNQSIFSKVLTMVQAESNNSSSQPFRVA